MRLGAFAILLAVLGSPASAVTVQWVDWTSATSNSATGVMNVGTTSIDVTFNNSVNNSFVQTSCGTNYWTTSSTYQSSSVDNAPSGCDIIALSAAGERTLTFSEEVEDVYFAFVSWNNNTGEFSTEIELLSIGPGFWGSGTVNVTDFILQATGGEPHGTLRLRGPLSEFSFTSGTESWHGFTIGVASLADDEPSPIPLPASSLLMLSGVAGLGLLRRRKRIEFE